MRTSSRSFLCTILLCCTLFGQKLNPPAGPVKPGDAVTLTGEVLGAATAAALKPADGKPDVPTTGFVATATSVKFTVPASAAAGAYKVHLSGVTVGDVELTVAASGQATPAPAATPVINSVFQTTIYPVQDRFTFEINGQNFDPDPDKDEVEIMGQGLIPFGSRHKSPDRGAQHKEGERIQCSEEDVKD